MNKAIIFGISDFSAIIYTYIKDTPNSPEISAFIVDRAYRKQDEFCGIPAEDAEDMVLRFPPSEYGVYLCVGYKKMNDGRRNVFERLKSNGYTVLNYFHPSAYIHTAEIGEGNIALHNVVIDIAASMGNGNIFMTNTVLGHHVCVGDFNWFSYHAVISGRAKIGDCCFIGLNASVAHNVVLSDKTLVGVGAVITNNTSEGDLIVPPKMVILKGKSRLAKF